MAGGHGKENNFDLIRLCAAFQIMLYHYYEHIHLSSPLLNRIIGASSAFSGIIILFTVSGFLIFASYDNNPDLKNYLRNRFLRVFPGLWLCLAFTIGMLAVLGFINGTNVFSKQFISWLASQLSFFQFYTPPMFRSFGVGNPNGALWTIPVELSFYVFVPFLFWLFRKIKISRNAWIILFMVLSIAYNVGYYPYKIQSDRSDLVKLMGINLAPYLFFFLLGALTYTNWEKISKWYKGKGLIWLGAYLIYYLVFSVWLGKFALSYWTGPYHFIAVVLLSQTTIAMAFTCQELSNKLLTHNDISYGIYVYHMPVINVLLHLGYGTSTAQFLLAQLAITILAIISWKFVERPAIRLKRSVTNKRLNS